MSHAANPAPKNLGDFTLPWPAERPANDYDDARRVYLTASVYHHGLTDPVRVAEARANSRVLRLANALMGEIVAVQAAKRHAELLMIVQHARIAVEQVLCNGRGHSKGRHCQAERCRNYRSKGFHGETSWSPPMSRGLPLQRGRCTRSLGIGGKGDFQD
jgi:hypothetical protein